MVMWTFLKVGQWYMLGWLAWVRKKRENIAASRIEDKETKQKAMKVLKKKLTRSQSGIQYFHSSNLTWNVHDV